MASNKQFAASIFIVIALLAFVNFFVGYYLGKNHEPITENETKTIEQKFDSVRVFIDRPIVVLRIDSYPVSTSLNNPIVIDTLSIVNRWLTGYVYTDSLRTKDLFLQITDSIEQNSIKHRHLVYKILRPDSIKVIERSRNDKADEQSRNGNAFFVGVGLGANRFSPGILYNIKNTFQIGLSSNLIGEKPTFEASFFYRIK
jgi:hypothetical protein